MNEFLFGSGNGRLLEDAATRIDRIARKHDAAFNHVHMPDGWRFWFATRDYGHPFNTATAQAVYADLKAAGLWTDDGVAEAARRTR